MGFLSNLQDNNQFPIIFIGSGITRRYFQDAPTWDQLLQQVWTEASPDKSYYAKYDELKRVLGGDTFKIYTRLAEELEALYDVAFYDGRIALDGLSVKQAHDRGVSPFRYRIAQVFTKLNLKSSVSTELKQFRGMLAKARLIVTTNYDDFIEEELNHAIKVRVGSQGLFEAAGDLNELYKIHGSVAEPNSIVITGKDYEQMVRSSAIVNAKILSLLTESPILFLGYSLTDKNIRSLLKDLSDNMPFSVEEAASRIGVVDYAPNQDEVVESLRDTDFGVHYTQLRTDNYPAIYSAVSKIDQGFSPLEISKYQGALKQIIEVKGQSGQLKEVLTTFVDLEKLPQALKNKNLVVALGDNRYLYKYPDYVEYIRGYFLNKNRMPTEIALHFIAQMSPQSPLPVSKYLRESMDIAPSIKAKLNLRLQRFNSLANIQAAVNVSHTATEKLDRYQERPVLEIYRSDDGVKATVKIAYFIKHIDSIDVQPLIEYILNEENANFIKQTNVRKLFMAYSLLHEPIIKQVR